MTGLLAPRIVIPSIVRPDETHLVSAEFASSLSRVHALSLPTRC